VKLLRAGKPLTFKEIIGGLKERAEVVARFLAILELYRMTALSFDQKSPLGDLVLTWRDQDFETEQLETLGAEYDSE
jgi:segregation and condensation protein A